MRMLTTLRVAELTEEVAVAAEKPPAAEAEKPTAAAKKFAKTEGGPSHWQVVLDELGEATAACDVSEV